MASRNPPLSSTELDRTHAPISTTRADDTMESITSPQLSPAGAENPFTDPQEEAAATPLSGSMSPGTSHAPLTSISYSAESGAALRANNPRNGTPVCDLTDAINSNPLTADPKPSSSKSTRSTATSSYETGTTLISSTYGGATTRANTNPFADPPQAQDQVLSGTQTAHDNGNGIGLSTLFPRSAGAPIYTHTAIPTLPKTNYLRPTPSPNPSYGQAPTPPPKSPLRALGSNRWTTVSSIKTHISQNLGFHPLAGNASATSLAREALALESARRQDILLETERARAKTRNSSSSQPNLQEPHLRPSPSALRIAAKLIRARDENVSYGAQAVLKAPVFWVAILGVEIGLVSTSAAIAVIIEADQQGDKAYVGAGRVFWLVISIVVFVLSGGAAWAMWLRKERESGGDEGVLRRLGCDEIGLLDRAVVRDVEMGRSDSDADADADADGRGERGGGSAAKLRAMQNLRQRRERGSIPTAGSLTSVRTRDPEWQVLYTTPKELRQMVSSEMLGDTPIRRGAYGLHQASDRTRGYEEQRANPPRKVASSNKPGFSNPVSLTRSDKSWPLRSSPNAAPFVNIHPEHPSPYQTSSLASDHAFLQRQYTSNKQNNNNSNPSPLSITHPPLAAAHSQIGHPQTHTEPRVEILSPLSSLTQSIQTASRSTLPLHHRPHYIHGHRVASEERVRSLRQSLEFRSRGNSATDASSRNLSRVQSNLSSAASDRFQEHIAEFGDGDGDEERVGRRRSRSMDVDVVFGDLSLSLKDDCEDKSENIAFEKASKTSHHQKAKDVLANVKGHFHTREQPRGRSLGDVVREKMARLKEAGVEPDLETASPIPTVPYPKQSSPLHEREREIFIIGDDSPTKTPAKTPQKSPNSSPASTPSKIPTATRNPPIASPNKAVLPLSPLSRKD
ncbi:hypothetical protein BKA65DRAFT_73073 [Rhexocercosporidium sp. MPI-PUGE-AT-0058]|nr:hypothetical protein BKA65DRAFT_73073 [Rhexocercosporidium sp. MPI-PUGE-AT-0058]